MRFATFVDAETFVDRVLRHLWTERHLWMRLCDICGQSDICDFCDICGHYTPYLALRCICTETTDSYFLYPYLILIVIF